MRTQAAVHTPGEQRAKVGSVTPAACYAAEKEMRPNSERRERGEEPTPLCNKTNNDVNSRTRWSSNQNAPLGEHVLLDSLRSYSYSGGALHPDLHPPLGGHVYIQPAAVVPAPPTTCQLLLLHGLYAFCCTGISNKAASVGGNPPPPTAGPTAGLWSKR